jgi:hypothetical protein
MDYAKSRGVDYYVRESPQNYCNLVKLNIWNAVKDSIDPYLHDDIIERVWRPIERSIGQVTRALTKYEEI